MVQGHSVPISADPPQERAPLRPARAAAAGAVGLTLAAVVAGRIGLSAEGVIAGAATAVLVWLAVIDLESRLVPNRIVVPAIAVLLATATAIDPLGGLENALAAFAAGGCLFVAALLRPGGLGMGDVKLAAFLGALLGAAVLQALTIGFVLLAVVGLAAVARRGRSALQVQLPLVPFLAVGAIVTLLLG